LEGAPAVLFFSNQIVRAAPTCLVSTTRRDRQSHVGAIPTTLPPLVAPVYSGAPEVTQAYRDERQR
jgi:hypothetical protein